MELKTPKYSDVRFQWLLNLFTLHIPELLWYSLIILSWSPLTKETDRSQIVFASHTHLDNHITCPSHLHLLVFPEILLLTLPSTFLKKLNKKAKLETNIRQWFAMSLSSTTQSYLARRKISQYPGKNQWTHPKAEAKSGTPETERKQWSLCKFLACT